MFHSMLVLCLLTSVCLCLTDKFTFEGIHPFPKLPLEKAVVEGPTCSIEVQCTDCAQKAAICAREFDPKKVLSKTPCCDKGFNMECCAKHDVIKELDKREECNNEEFYCMCHAYMFENVLRSSGMCCGNETCNCCETDPSIEALKRIVLLRNDGCDDGGVCTLSEGKPSSKCCDEHYELNSKLIYGQLKTYREKDETEICGPNGLKFYYSPEFPAQTYHSPAFAIKACADKTTWALFTQKMAPPSSTPSKAIGVAMTPSATYAIVVGLVLVRFVLFR